MDLMEWGQGCGEDMNFLCRGFDVSGLCSPDSEHATGNDILFVHWY